LPPGSATPPCPGCGRQGGVRIRGLCIQCFIREYVVPGLPDRLTGEVCRRCGSVRMGGRWSSPSYTLEEAVSKFLSHAIGRLKISSGQVNVSITAYELETKPDWTTKIKVELTGTLEGEQAVAHKLLTIRLEPSVCPRCTIYASGEYDTVIQVRGIDAGKAMEILRMILENSPLAGDVIEVAPVKRGIDVYLSHRGAASKLIKMLSKKLDLNVRGPYRELVGLTPSGRRRTRNTIIAHVTGIRR